MNAIDKILTKPISQEALKYGLPILHANIRFLECVLNVSYRLKLESWRVSLMILLDLVVSIFRYIFTWSIQVPRGNEDFKKAKGLIQEGLRKKLGILVDTPKQGFGSTNDGNTARVFFKNVDLVAEVTGAWMFWIVIGMLEIAIYLYSRHPSINLHLLISKY